MKKVKYNKIKWTLKFWVKEVKKWGWGVVLTNLFVILFMRIVKAKKIHIEYEK